MGQIRLYIAQPLTVGSEVVLNEQQSHYLTHVMKLKVGDTISCFDNQSGEYGCTLIAVGKKQTTLKVLEHHKPYTQTPDIWLLFAPVKKDNTDFIIQKATELGVRKIIPVQTRYTITERIKRERFEAQAIEAAEQCRRVDLPQIAEIKKFDDILQQWDKTRILYYMDETLTGKPIAQALENAKSCAILVGPEGGFSAEELAKLRGLSFARAVCLGPRILRAETAVVSALSCWQALKGDWQ